MRVHAVASLLYPFCIILEVYFKLVEPNVKYRKICVCPGENIPETLQEGSEAVAERVWELTSDQDWSRFVGVSQVELLQFLHLYTLRRNQFRAQGSGS